MASRQQRKVWRYVEDGRLLKLKSYLRKHRAVEVNFTRGKRRRGVLHLVCSRGDDALLRLLLEHGADPLLKDRNGDTPLHLAARRARKHGKAGEGGQGSSDSQGFRGKERARAHRGDAKEQNKTKQILYVIE